jgi:hypothetical protein
LVPATSLVGREIDLLWADMPIIFKILGIQLVFWVSTGTALYWCKKYENPEFHPNTHGGSRRAAFSNQEFLEINEILWEHCQMKPTSRLVEFGIVVFHLTI